MTLARAPWARVALALVLGKAAVSLAVIAAGFSHVSDDDYARVVIAQGFALAPRVDPSGTSWLPAPFWLAGSAMIITGRSLLAARVVALLLGALAPLPAVFALRRSGIRESVTFLGLGLALASPWSAWSGAATIPDGWCAALVAASAFALIDDRTLGVAAGCAAVAALSRYEAWPVCAIVALRASRLIARPGATASTRYHGGRALGLALAAPLGWMIWNRFAHGDALHFLARVATFRRQLGAADVPLASKLAEYPRALWSEAPESLVLGLVGALGLLALPAALRARHSLRWRWPLLVAVAVTSFLVVGDVGDGAPTHHPVRPLLGVITILIVWGVDTLAAITRRAPSRRRQLAGAAIALVTAGILGRDLLSYRQPPGTGAADRVAQLRRGDVLRESSGPADRLRVTPCAYEHFALLASFAAPERAILDPARARADDDEECPRVSLERPSPAEQ